MWMAHFPKRSRVLILRGTLRNIGGWNVSDECAIFSPHSLNKYFHFEAGIASIIDSVSRSKLAVIVYLCSVSPNWWAVVAKIQKNKKPTAACKICLKIWQLFSNGARYFSFLCLASSVLHQNLAWCMISFMDPNTKKPFLRQRGWKIVHFSYGAKKKTSTPTCSAAICLSVAGAVF